MKRFLSRIIRYHMIKSLRRGAMVSIFPSWKCNYQCSYCLLRTNGVYPESELLSLDSWKEFLTELDIALDSSTGRGIKEISLLGGEPTLLPYFVDLCHWIVFEKRWQLMIFTNLWHTDKLLKVRPSLLLRIEATFHNKEWSGEFTRKYKKVNRVHRVIPRQLGDEISYAHKDLICAQESEKDNHCPPFLRIAPDQTITLKYSSLCERKTN